MHTGGNPSFLKSKHSRFVILAALLGMLLPSAAMATHFRFGQVTWKPDTTGPANTIEFTATLGYRRSFFSGSHADGDPQPGDLISPDALSFGDSSSVNWQATVTDYNVGEDWILAEATATHTYASAQTYLAFIDSGNRSSACASGNAHLNNPDGSYRVESSVDVGSGNSSPVSCLPPIVRCAQGQPCSFQIPTSDNEDDPLTFSMSTQPQSKINVQPGTANSCTGGAASVSPTGVYSWDSAGCTVASGSCSRTFYSTQVTMQESAGDAKAAIDFFVQLVNCAPTDEPPVFGPQTPCGSTLSTTPGTNVSFSVDVSDNDSLDVTTASSACVPVDADTTPPLPQSGNPISSTFSWTPTAADVGQHVMTFAATDICGQQALCAVTIDVSEEICDNTTDDDGDLLIDCDDPDCASSLPCLPTPSPTATDTPDATSTPESTDTPDATSTPESTDTPDATSTPTETDTPEPTAVSTPTLPAGGSAFILRKVQLKANTSNKRPNGRIIARGILDVNAPLEGFPADVAANGLSVHVDSGTVSETVTWTAAECESKEPRAGRLSIRCFTADRDHLIKFRPVSGVIAPNVYQVIMVSKRRTVALPMVAAPVTIILDVNGPDPADTIGATGTCRVKGAKAHKLNCQEKGIFN